MPTAPIDPVHARAIFIREGVIDGALDAACPALAANRRLLAELETLQAKARRPLLIDEDALFALYDARLPAEVWDGHRFEHWLRRQAPDALRLSADQLLTRPRRLPITPQDYPDRLAAGGALLPLRYRFEPGHDDDGITVRLPRRAAAADRCRCLRLADPRLAGRKMRGADPQPARRAAPAVRAGAGLRRPGRGTAEAGHGSAAAGAGRRAVGIWPASPARRRLSTPTAWTATCACASRSWTSTARRWPPAGTGRNFKPASVRPRRPSRPPGRPHALERGGITAWDFGALPRQVTTPGPGGALLLRWPALVDTGEACAVRLFDDEAAAAAAHRGGVRALLTRALAERLADAGHARRRRRRFTGALARPAQLLRDLQRAIIDSAWDDPNAPRDGAEFAALAAALQARLAPIADRLTRAVTDTLRAWRDIERQLDHATTLALLEVAADLRDQLGRLIHRGFVADTPPPWLTELPRYLHAAAARLERAQRNPTAERTNRQALQALWQAFWQDYPPHTDDPAWIELRWLLEELRVALFAPELGTVQPVSVARLSRLLQEQSHP